MKKYVVEATKSSPYICLDPESNTLELKGESYPENCAKFYSPMFRWLEDYLPTADSERIKVSVELVYFNSSSSKVLMDLFDLLDEAARQGREIVVDWRYHEENETALECGEEFMEDVSELTFNLVKFC